MNFLTTGTKLKYVLIFVISITFINFVSAQKCFTSTDGITLCYKGSDIIFELPCSETNGTTAFAVTVENVTGGTAPYTVIPESGSNGRVSKTKVRQGSGFIYSFTLDDLQNNLINFQIVDQNGKTASLDNFIINSIANNLFSGNCEIIDPYFLVSDDTVIEEGETEVFTAIECILLNDTFEVKENADFEAGITN